jgi:hypothetical protein
MGSNIPTGMTDSVHRFEKNPYFWIYLKEDPERLNNIKNH